MFDVIVVRMAAKIWQTTHAHKLVPLTLFLAWHLYGKEKLLGRRRMPAGISWRQIHAIIITVPESGAKQVHSPPLCGPSELYSGFIFVHVFCFSFLFCTNTKALGAVLEHKDTLLLPLFQSSLLHWYLKVCFWSSLACTLLQWGSRWTGNSTYHACSRMTATAPIVRMIAFEWV